MDVETKWETDLGVIGGSVDARDHPILSPTERGALSLVEGRELPVEGVCGYPMRAHAQSLRALGILKVVVVVLVMGHATGGDVIERLTQRILPFEAAQPAVTSSLLGSVQLESQR